MFGNAARDDEAADSNVITGLNSHPSRKVDGSGCRCRRLQWELLSLSA